MCASPEVLSSAWSPHPNPDRAALDPIFLTKLVWKPPLLTARPAGALMWTATQHPLGTSCQPPWASRMGSQNGGTHGCGELASIELRVPLGKVQGCALGTLTREQPGDVGAAVPVHSEVPAEGAR